MVLALSLFVIVNYTSYDFGSYADMAAYELQIGSAIYIIDLPKSDAGADGYMCPNVDGSFSIYIKKGIARKLAVLTMLHELVHVRQMLDGRLVYLDGKGFKVLWEGQVYDKQDSLNPWEVEACKQAKRLYFSLKDGIDNELTKL